MKAVFRQVHVYDLEVRSKKKGATLPSLVDLITVLESRRAAGLAFMSVSNGDIHITIGDIALDSTQQTVTVLVRYSDRHAADSVYSDIRANSFKAHPKSNGEGGETGCHVFISTAEEVNSPNTYTCVIEKVPNITKDVVRRLFNNIFRDEYGVNPNFFTYPSPTGQRVKTGGIAMDRCLPRVEIEARPSEQFASDIQRGRLTGITLVKSVTKTPIGGVPYIIKSEATLKLEVDHGSVIGNMHRGIKKAIASQASSYPVAKVALKLPDRKKSVTVKLDTRTGSPLGDLYIKTIDVLNISPPMAQSSRSIAPQLDGRVLPLLIAERDI